MAVNSWTSVTASGRAVREFIRKLFLIISGLMPEGQYVSIDPLEECMFTYSIDLVTLLISPKFLYGVFDFLIIVFYFKVKWTGLRPHPKV